MAKSLKQLREDHDKKFEPKELVLEASNKTIPNSKEMPPILLFRRITYKVYPNKQVVALYYARSIDKYLSVPFGPGGNLNLHEARIIDIEEEDFIPTNPVPCEETFKAKLKQLRELTDAEERDNAGISQNFGWKENVPGYVDQKKASGNWNKGNYGQALKYGVRSFGKKLATAGTLGALGLTALAGGGAAATSIASRAAGSGAAGAVGKDMVSGNNITAPQPSSLRPKPIVNPIKTTTSSKLAKPAAGASFQAKLRNYDMKLANQAKSNIQEIRNMVNEGVGQKEIMINEKPITINTSMAKRILEVYDSVNNKNKKIVENMLDSDLESFKKLLNFSIKA